MRKFISIVLMLAVVFTSVAVLPAENSHIYADTAADAEEVYYHLDIGVWCLPKVNDKWDKGIAYGSIQSNSPVITFGRDIEVIGAHWYQGEDDVFQFSDKNCTSNVPGGTWKDYWNIYNKYVSTNITNITAENKDGSKRDVKLSYSVKLDSPKKFNVAQTARDFQTSITTYKEIITEYNKEVYVLTGTERANVEKLYERYITLRDSYKAAYDANNTAVGLSKYRTYKNLASAVKNQLDEKKVVTTYVTETQAQLNDREGMFDKYKNDIYSFWGNEANLKKLDMDLWNILDKSWEGAFYDDKMEIDLVFIPIVIEYKAAPVACTACNKCLLTGNETVCSENSCKDYGTENCGCYAKCENCNICPIDTGSGYSICTTESCSKYGTAECGCYATCENCGKCKIDKSRGDKVCTDRSCINYQTTSCGCYEGVTVPSGNCTDTITWTETKSHTYSVPTGHKSSCYKEVDGEKVKVCNVSQHYSRRTCNHSYTYKAVLTASGTLTAAKPNGNSTTFKSGYGFSVTMTNNVSVAQTGNSGSCGSSLSKAHSASVQAPLSAEVRTSWTVKHREQKVSQPKNISLERATNTGKKTTFICAVNPISQYSERLIFTDVALKGTKKSPVKHTIKLYSYGGGVDGREFCINVPLTFTINGDMYEDDWTVDTRK